MMSSFFPIHSLPLSCVLLHPLYLVTSHRLSKDDTFAEQDSSAFFCMMRKAKPSAIELSNTRLTDKWRVLFSST
jgi:hypothetical protein